MFSYPLYSYLSFIFANLNLCTILQNKFQIMYYIIYEIIYNITLPWGTPCRGGRA